MGQEVIIRCHCGVFNERVRLQDEIPVQGALCHCNSCRHVTGALVFSGITLSNPPVDALCSKLTKYPSSTKLDRYFCPICGSHVSYRTTRDDRWSVCPGAIDEIVGGNQGKLERYTEHAFVGDTIDGGLSWAIPNIPFCLEDEGETPMSNPRSELRQLYPAQAVRSETLDAECHCGQVKFSVARPSGDSSRWEGGLCACRSCRLSFSQPITAWMWNVPYEKITWPGGAAHDGTARHGLTRFQSSDHSHREFCSKCGACIFYDTTKQPGLLDVAFGVLRADDGALARSFVKWDTDKVCYIEDAIDRDLVGMVKDNLDAIKEDEQ